MQYYVIGPDGARYGPPDVSTLHLWITENRLTPVTMLEEVATARRIPASSIDGLFPNSPFGSYPSIGQPNPTQAAAPYDPMSNPSFGTMYQNPPTPSQYQRYGQSYQSSTELTVAWIMFALGLFLCLIAPITCSVGTWMAIRAERQGYPGASVAKGLNIAVLVLGILIWLVIGVGSAGGGG